MLSGRRSEDSADEYRRTSRPDQPATQRTPASRPKPSTPSNAPADGDRAAGVVDAQHVSTREPVLTIRNSDDPPAAATRSAGDPGGRPIQHPVASATTPSNGRSPVRTRQRIASTPLVVRVCCRETDSSKRRQVLNAGDHTSQQTKRVHADLQARRRWHTDWMKPIRKIHH